MQDWLKGQSHILKTAIMVPRKRLSRANAATFWPRGQRALRARRPEGKKFAYLPIQVVVFFHNDKSNMGRVVQHFLFRIIDNDTYVIHTCPVKRVAILFIN